jgi:hypothetical protein
VAILEHHTAARSAGVTMIPDVRGGRPPCMLCTEKLQFRNGELNLLWPVGGCQLQAGTGRGWPGQAPGRC